MGGGLVGTPGAVYGKPVDYDKLRSFASLKGKHLIIADTIEELAEGMGVPADALAETIKKYNEACKAGKDEDFFKPAQHLKALETAPYYAFSTFLATDGAFGGIEVNENMQVLGADGPIENLFAGGDICSSYYVIGEGRKNTIINDFSWAVASGYVAGSFIAGDK